MTSKPATAVPNDFPVVQAVYEAGDYDLTSHEGQAAFVDDVVVALHAHDARWGHLKKNPGQTQIHGHAEDAALYLSPTEGQSTAVDFVAGAGGSNPTPAWQPDIPRYSASDWMDPADHEGVTGHPPPPLYPSYEALGGDAGGVAISTAMEADYVRSGRPGLDGGCGAWMQRTVYDFLTGKFATVEDSIEAHRAEWCAELGVPVAP